MNKQTLFIAFLLISGALQTNGSLVFHAHIPSLSVLASLNVPGLKEPAKNKQFKNPSAQEAYELQKELFKTAPRWSNLLAEILHKPKDNRLDIPDIFWYKILFLETKKKDHHKRATAIFNSLLQTSSDKESSNKFIQSISSILSHIQAPNNWALSKACEFGVIEIVKKHVESGADIHFEQESPLHDVCKYGYFDIAKYLLVNGARAQQNALNLLTVATHYNRPSIVSLLLAHGADVHYQHDSALYVAVSSGNFEIFKVLLGAGADKKRAVYEVKNCLSEANKQKSTAKITVYTNMAYYLRHVDVTKSDLLGQK